VLSSIWTTDRPKALERFIELCELAAPLGLTVDLEFVSFAAVRTLAESLRVVSACRCANAGICLDTLHFDRSGAALQALESVPPRYWHYAQICDAPAQYSNEEAELKRVAREARLFLGEGGIDVGSILARLPAMPYSIELPNAQRLAALGPEEFAHRCLRSAQMELQRKDRVRRPI
jgi:sugar phosphate isomerase/epimerase